MTLIAATLNSEIRYHLHFQNVQGVEKRVQSWEYLNIYSHDSGVKRSIPHVIFTLAGKCNQRP